MKFFYSLLLALFISQFIYAQDITERSYNHIFNLSAYSPLEAKAGQKGDDVDALFDKVGLTSSDSRNANIYTGFAFTNSTAQTFSLKKQEDGSYTISSQLTNNVISVSNASKSEGANVVPAKYVKGEHQKFLIKRDTVKYRFGAFIIAKHSGMALTISDDGNVVQEKLDPNSKKQIWVFSQRYQFKNSNSDKFLGLTANSFAPENAILNKSTSGTTSWCYIAHPNFPNAYYLMNSNTKQFLMTKEEYDKNNMLEKYTLFQSHYKAGKKNAMLFYMIYADDTKKGVNIHELFTRYVIDVENGSSQLILLPKAEQEKKTQKWELYKAKSGF